MLSVGTVRRLCAAFDAVAATFIAANLSKSIATAANPSTHTPENFPTIAACAAAISRNRSNPKPESHPEPPSTIPSHPNPIGEPALFKIKAEREPEKLFHLFESNARNRLVVENRFAFEDTVSRLAGARRLDLVERLLEQQKALPQGRREGFVVRIITLYGRAGMPDHARRTFDQMHLFGCSRTVKSFNATLKVLSQARCFDEVRIFFSEAPAQLGIQIDEISYNTIIKVLCEMGSLDSAYLVMVEMEKAGLKPDVVTYTTLMSAAYKSGRRQIGDGLWNLMVIRGLSPNLVTFNIRIQYLINRRRAWQANSFVRKMDVTGIKPDELTYNLLIKGFCMVGELEMAKRIFFAMPRRGCKQNSRIYQTMVHYLCKGGVFDLAFGLCKDSMERNWFPSIDTVNALLKGLITNLKVRNARTIMRLVKGRMPPYSTDELKAFQDIFSHGSTQKEH